MSYVLCHCAMLQACCSAVICASRRTCRTLCRPSTAWGERSAVVTHPALCRKHTQSQESSWHSATLVVRRISVPPSYLPYRHFLSKKISIAFSNRSDKTMDEVVNACGNMHFCTKLFNLTCCKLTAQGSLDPINKKSSCSSWLREVAVWSAHWG
jgi:hypothetical protein